MQALDTVGVDWLCDEVGAITEEIIRVRPSDFSEEHRYLPESVTSTPGFMRFDLTPYMREIVDCFDVNSPVREVNLKKGVQIGYSTALESGALYFMAHVRTLPGMYITADKEMATERIEHNFLPMLQQSGFDDIIQSADEGNTRKTGKTAKHLQWRGGGYLIPIGALNAAKMRSYSISWMLKDEVDKWPDKVGKDGDPDTLTSDRCSGFWETRKIFRGSTPLVKGSSAIETAYLNGDQREYLVLCKKCRFPQKLRWETVDEETGIVGGMQWDMDDGTLVLESVRYCCQKCGEPHYEYDKERLFSESDGAHWHPTAKPSQPGIRSYHLPALYSPAGMAPWHKCVADYLSGFDPETKKVIDLQKFKTFYNNILGEPFEERGSRISFVSVSGHRRSVYRYGQIPNEYAMKYSGSPVLFCTCLVDVHKSFLAVSVIGWTRDARSYLIDYLKFEDEDCGEITSPVWGKLREVIEEREYTADDGKVYRMAITLIDAGYMNDTVNKFCADYSEGVYPILGRKRPGKNQRILEFTEFKAQDGTVGYMITVDHYKDRMAPVLRREWMEDEGEQGRWHFNAPLDATDAQLKELTVETRKQKIDPNGIVTYEWHRPGNARNELWDLLGYGHAAVEILAWRICVGYFELETVDWPKFWDYIESEQSFFQSGV